LVYQENKLTEYNFYLHFIILTIIVIYTLSTFLINKNKLDKYTLF